MTKPKRWNVTTQDKVIGTVEYEPDSLCAYKAVALIEGKRQLAGGCHSLKSARRMVRQAHQRYQERTKEMEKTHATPAIKSEFTRGIIRGDFDDVLAHIMDAVKSRRTIVRQIENTAKRAEFKVGDRVRFIDLRPKYMIGLEATIVEFLRTKIAVKVAEEHQHEARRFAHGQIVVSPSMIEKV